MKIHTVHFNEPISLPGARAERVINLSDTRQGREFDLELDHRGFVRVRVLEGAGKGETAFVGPLMIKAAFTTAEQAQPPPPKK